MKKFLLVLFCLIFELGYTQSVDLFRGEVGTGNFKKLLNRPGNGSNILKVRTSYTGTTTGGSYAGTWSIAGTWVAGQIVNYPTGSPLYWRSNASVSAGENTPDQNSKWDIEVGVDFIQDSGDGINFFRYTTGFRNDDFIRIQNIQYGTLSSSSFTWGLNNYAGNGVYAISTSATSFSVPTVHPSSRTFTIGAGLTIPNSSIIGSSIDNLTISSTAGVIVQASIGAGLSISPGETLTFYADTNNFFCVVVARYNASTGALYAVNVGLTVGSGTFSSWTIKKEVVRYVYRTVDEPTTRWIGLVQSYDSGTGSITMNSVKHGGSGTFNAWTFALGLVPADPGTSQSLFFGNSLNVRGSYFLCTFRGTRLIHKSTVDNRGTGWLYIYLSGPDQANPPANVTIDTYNASSLSDQAITAFSNLTEGTHQVLAVAVTSSNGLSANTRAWVNADSDTENNKSIGYGYDYDVFNSVVDINLLNSESVGEFAYSFRDTDSGDTYRWMPEHANIKTMVGRLGRVFKIDGLIVDHSAKSGASGLVNSYLFKYKNCSNVTLNQTLTVVHPQAVGDMATALVNHKFDRNGLFYDVRVTWLQSASITVGYHNMLSFSEGWFNKVKTDLGEYINRPADNSTVNLTSGQAGNSNYIFYSTSVASPQKDLAVSVFWPNQNAAWRIGELDTGVSFIQDFSGAAGAKFYPNVFNNHSVSPGEVMLVKGRIYLGKWIDANSGL